MRKYVQIQIKILNKTITKLFSYHIHLGTNTRGRSGSNSFAPSAKYVTLFRNYSAKNYQITKYKMPYKRDDEMSIIYCSYDYYNNQVRHLPGVVLKKIVDAGFSEQL